jgi:hypothetical protein
MTTDASSKPAKIQQWPTTHWSLVGRLGKEGAEDRRRRLSQLIVLYSPVLRRHLMRKWHIKAGEVDDLLQEFLTSKILEKDILRMADQTRGKFRTFLATALDRFTIDHARFRDAGKRKFVKGEGNEMATAWKLPSSRAPDSFDVAWAKFVISGVVELMRDECQKRNRIDIWETFRLRILAPSYDGDPPMPYQDLIVKFKLSSAREASNLLRDANRMFQRLLRRVIGAYDKSSADIDEEIRELRRIFS